MFSLPFFRFPYYNYYPYYSCTKKDVISSCQNSSDFVENSSENDKFGDSNKVFKNNPSKYNSFNLINFLNPFGENIDNEKPILDILGLELYFDDILLICLLFLLYTEKTRDETLFYILILLLFT